MFFDDLKQIPEIAVRRGTSVFVVPADLPVEISGAIVLEPEEKITITIEQVRKIMLGLALRQTSERMVVIRPADALGVEAANALLKNLEEPGEKVHYLLITDSPARLLPTILSRAGVYFLRTERGSDTEIVAEETSKAMAKQLIAGRPDDLIKVAETITKKKPSARWDALAVLGLTIEMLYKSYYLTNREVFIKRLPAVLKAYENISKNGHIKLHLVADLC